MHLTPSPYNCSVRFSVFFFFFVFSRNINLNCEKSAKTYNRKLCIIKSKKIPTSTTIRITHTHSLQKKNNARNATIRYLIQFFFVCYCIAAHSATTSLEYFILIYGIVYLCYFQHNFNNIIQSEPVDNSHFYNIFGYIH